MTAAVPERDELLSELLPFLSEKINGQEQLIERK